MRQKKSLAFAFREGSRELASEVGRVSERARLKTRSRSFRARSRALRSTAPEAILECSSSDEDEVSLAWREIRGFPGGVVATSGSRGWKLSACGGFFREENMIVLEARSILFAVRYSESKYPPGRLPTLSDTCAGFGARNKFHIAFSHASDLCVWFLGASELNCSGDFVSLNVIMTRANHFFKFMRSTQHVLLPHGQLSKKDEAGCWRS